MTDDPREPQAPHDLLAAYLLDAVDDRERRRFEEHLLDCPDCEREIARLAPTVAVLGASVPADPPTRLREAVLREVAASRAPGSVADAPDDDLSARRAARSSRRLLLLAGAAAAVAVVMALMFGPFRDAEMTPATVAAAGDAQRYEARLDGATATVVVSRSLDKAAIETRGMPPAPEGRDYQLWFTRADGTMTAAGVMPPTADAAMVLTVDVGDAVGVGITVEPSGGSTQPSGDPILLIPFEA